MMQKQSRRAWTWVVKKLRTMFLAGLIVVVPIGLTIWILIWIFANIDGMLQPFILRLFGVTFTGVGVAITLILILVVGAITTNVIGHRIVGVGERILGRIPIARRVYVALKEIFQSFSDPAGTGFMQVVLVEFPAKGMKTIAFITNEETDREGHKVINIFIPTALNPTGGFVEVVREEDIIRTSITVEDALKMAVSAGRMSPKNLSDYLLKENQKSEVAR